MGTTMAASRKKPKREGLDLRKKLALLMEACEIKQSGLYRKTGIHQSRISKWLHGEGKPDEERIFKIAEVFGVPFDYLGNPSRTEFPNLLLLRKEVELLNAIREIGVEEAMRRIMLPPSSKK